ncbi:MAG: SipW-dependent-type signal peptide-containing protein, partial [Firmicutes bacterium]|nr:SipW-dependent-type signal peptide-containing protein [Bacillota bacterium]
MKKKIFAVMMVLICLAIAATGTLAYFTSEETAHNIITTGAVDIDLEEWQDLDGDGQNYTPYPPENQPINVMPGVTVSKIATIKSLEAD